MQPSPDAAMLAPGDGSQQTSNKDYIQSDNLQVISRSSNGLRSKSPRRSENASPMTGRDSETELRALVVQQQAELELLRKNAPGDRWH